MKKLFLPSIMFMIILSNIVFATGSISISSITIPSSVTVGDTFTITMSVTGSEATDVSGSLTLPSGISCTPSSSQSISLGGDGTGTASWSCTASAAGDYTNQITASVSAKDSGTGSSLTDSQQTGLQLLSPASLTISSAISASSITTSGTATFTVGVNNAGGTSTTYAITLSCPSGLTCTPSSVESNSIDGSTLENNAFTITPTTAGTYTLAGTVTGNDQTLTTSQSLTVTSVSQTPGGSPGGSTGGTPSNVHVNTKKGNANITIQAIANAKIESITITKIDDVAFRQINISFANAVNNIKIVINKLAGQPAAVIHEISGKVYHYIEINKENLTDSNVRKVFIKFAVSKSWLTTNSVNKLNVSLYRWENNRWNELTTNYLSEDLSETFYQAESPGFSYFLIGTKSGEATPVEQPTGAAITCTESWSCSDWSTISCINGKKSRTCTDINDCGTTVSKPAESQLCEVETGKVSSNENLWVIYSVAAVLFIAIIAILFIFRHKITPMLKLSKKK